MKWQNQNVFPLLIINAWGTFTGLFVYSPAPGAGNLVDSVAAAAGTDPYSNAYLAGMVNYFQVSPTSFLAVQTYQGQVTFYTATSAGGPWIAVGEIQILSDGIKLIGTGEIQLNVGLTLLTINVNRLLASSAMEVTGDATPAAPAAGHFG